MFDDLKYLALYLLHQLKEYKLKVVVMIIGWLSAFVSSLFLVYISKPALDDALFKGNWILFLHLSLLAGLFFILNAGLNLLCNIWTESFKNKFLYSLHKKAAENFYGLPLVEIKKTSSGENAFLLDYDPDILAEFIFSELPQFLSIFKAVIFLGVSFYLCWQLTLVALIFIPLYLLQTFFLARTRRYLKNDIFLTAKKYISYTQESFQNIKLVKAFSLETFILKRYLNFLEEKLKSRFMYLVANFKISSLDNLFICLAGGLFWLLGGYLIISRKISIGTFGAVTVYLSFLIRELNILNNAIQTSFEDIDSFRRSLSIIKSDFSLAKDVNSKISELNSSCIELRDVWFGYSPDKMVIKGVSLKFLPRTWTVISGPSGSGKTTLVGIILGLFAPLKGEIFFDGINIKDLGRSLLSKNISVALQEPLLWNDTILNNIAFGIEDYHLKNIFRVSHIACVDEFISGLPKGYNTSLGEAGFVLSEGQKQRIAIARALARNPRILILDEATSSIDIETESRILNNIREHFPDITLILISHRPQTLKFADEIYILESGMVLKSIERCSPSASVSESSLK